MTRLLCFVCLLINPIAVFAAEKVVPPVFSWLSVLNMLFGLAVVLGIIYGLSWVLKKYSRLPGSNQVEMKILGGISLSTRERVVLVQVEGKKILLGVAPGRVNLLQQFDDKPFEQTLATAMEQKP